jgi:hypothetical protein
MRCYICNNPTGVNAMDDLDEREFDLVVEHHGLIHCQGTDEQFDAEGNVIMCPECAADATTH